MTQSQTLMEQLAGHVKHGDHLCVICESEHERLEVAAQYIADGLREDDMIMYAADPGAITPLQQLLSRMGIDVEGETRRGALNILNVFEVHLQDGKFNADAMYEMFERTIRDALGKGFKGCRFAGEPSWAIQKQSQLPDLMEFESRLNGLFRTRPATGLCVYDKETWSASVIRDVLRTHPIAVVNDLVCERNIYYERPDLIAKEVSAKTQVDWMLARLRELRTQESKLQIALEAGRLGSWELDLRTDTSVRSLRHDQIFGYERTLQSWGYERFMEHVVPEDREHVDMAFRQALENGTVWHFECRIKRHNDGAIRWIEAHGRPDPERSTGTRVQRLLGIVADITERKEMEQALRDGDRRKDEFLATLAHELRNPLAPILNALQLMQMKSSMDPHLQQIQGVIDRQVRHLVRLVDDLLEVSRITTGRIVLQRERIELRTVLVNAIEASQPLFDSQEHHFSMELPQNPIYLEGDPTRLAQVFLNILNNAAKYTPRGGHISLTASSDGSMAEIRIRDTGMGLAKEFIPDMFKMFVQGHKSGEHVNGGLGIGLPLAKQLVELHGGSIEARSEGLGKGSEFIVRLPASADIHVKKESSASTAHGKSGSKRILVVDDNADAADILVATLELLGHEASKCYNGKSALEAFSQFDPDIAVLDIGLPDLDGYELARRLRTLKPEVTLVALTGWGQEKDRLRAREAGFDLHHTKPVNPVDLLAAIMEVHQAQPRAWSSGG